MNESVGLTAAGAFYIPGLILTLWQSSVKDIKNLFRRLKFRRIRRKKSH